MKIETKISKNNEQDNIVSMQPEDMEVLSSVNMPFSDLLSQELTGEEKNGSFLSNLYNLKVDYNYDSLAMSLEDAMFFVNLTQDGQFSVEVNNDKSFQSLLKIDVSQNVVTQKTVDVTNQLTSLIEKAQNTQKPVRISFDNDVSVVIKIDKAGKVTAEFIPGSVEVENYLRNNIASLKQKFDEQNLPYNDLFYRQNGRQNKNRNRNKGEQ